MTLEEFTDYENEENDTYQCNFCGETLNSNDVCDCDISFQPII